MDLNNIINCKKITIIGCSGSGKSTLALELGKILNLPVCHVDCYYWQPNWQKPKHKDFLRCMKIITKGEAWITEGTYSSTLKNRFKKSDLIISLDLPMEVCLASASLRHENKQRLGLPSYLGETNENFQGLINHIENYAEYHKDYVAPLMKKYQHKIITFTTREHARNFIKQLQDIKK